MKNADMPIQVEKDQIEQQPLPISVTLHLLPGLLILLFYVVSVPLVTEWSFPASFATLLGFVFVGIPFELGFLYYQGYRKNQKLSLKGIVRYRERIPFWQYPVIVIILILYAVVVSSLMSPVGAYLRGSVLSFLPAWFLNPSLGEPDPVVLRSLVET